MANKKTAAPAPEHAGARIDVSPLVIVVRNGDTAFWIFESGTAQPEPLTHRKCMFVNAALCIATEAKPAIEGTPS